MEFLFLLMTYYSSALFGTLMLALYFISKKRDLSPFSCHLFLGLSINYFVLFIYQDLFLDYIAQRELYDYYQYRSTQRMINALHAVVAIYLIAKNFRQRNLAFALGGSALILLFIQLVSFNGFVSGPLRVTLLIAGIIYVVVGKKPQQETITEPKPGFLQQFVLTLLINVLVFMVYSFPVFSWLFGSGGEGMLMAVCYFAVIHGVASLIVANRGYGKQNRAIGLGLMITGLLILFLGITGGLFFTWAQGFGSGWHN